MLIFLGVAVVSLTLFSSAMFYLLVRTLKRNEELTDRLSADTLEQYNSYARPPTEKEKPHKTIHTPGSRKRMEQNAERKRNGEI